jgi:hypothetical protein
MSGKGERRMTSGQALHQLHTALPTPVNFTLGRHEWTHAQGREAAPDENAFTEDSEWCVVVQWPDEETGADRYMEATRGEDLAEVVEQAIGKFVRWSESQRGAKPPKLTAPGAADVADVPRKQRDVS